MSKIYGTAPSASYVDALVPQIPYEAGTRVYVVHAPNVKRYGTVVDAAHPEHLRIRFDDGYETRVDYRKVRWDVRICQHCGLGWRWHARGECLFGSSKFQESLPSEPLR